MKPALLMTGVVLSAMTTLAATNDIIVSATRSMRLAETVPVHESIITAETISKGDYVTTPEVLNREAGVYFRNFTDNPSQANIDMRGFGENSHGRVLILLNGRKLNSPDLATVNWSQIALRNIDRIEVLRGPGTAMYGDNANGGVVNIITVTGSEEPIYGADLTLGSHGFSDAGIYSSGNLSGLGYAASINRQASDGYREQSNYDNLSGAVNLRSAITKQLDGELMLSANQREYELPGDLTQVQKNADRRQSVDDSDVKDYTFNSDLGFELKPTDEYTLHLNTGLLYMEQEANLNREFGPFATFLDTDKLSGTISPRFTTTKPIQKLDNELTIGVDLRYEALDVQLHADENRNGDGNNASVIQQMVDLYAIDSLYLGESFILTGAGRLNWNVLSVEEETSAGVSVFDDEETRNEQAASLGFTWLPADKAKFYAKTDRFYRYPFVDEQASYLGFLESTFNDLEPETGYNIEIGTSVAPRDDIQLRASAYYMPMRNEVAFDPATFINVNLDDTLRQGAEFNIDYAPVSFASIHADYIFTLAEFNGGVNKGNQVPGVPKNRAQLRVNFYLTQSLTFETGVRYTGSQYPINDNGNNTGGQDDYTLTDVRLNYSTSYKRLTYSVYAGVDNLFGEEYDYYQISNAAGTIVNYYPAPERIFRAGIKLLF